MPKRGSPELLINATTLLGERDATTREHGERIGGEGGSAVTVSQINTGWRPTPKENELTPHNVVVRPENGEEKVYPSVGSARVTTTSEVVGQVDGIDIVAQSYGDIDDLPAPQDGVLYIVSLVVRMAAQEQGREDVISPDTSPAGAIRNEAGQIVAVRRFVR